MVLFTRGRYLVFSIVCLLTVVLGYYALQLQTTMRWIDLLPENHRQAENYETITSEFTAASSITVLVQGNYQRIRTFADELAPLLEGLEEPLTGERLVKRVDYKKDSDFIRQHALMLADTDYLAHTWEVYKDPSPVGFLSNLNDALEKEYIEGSEGLSGRERQQRAIALLDGILAWLTSLDGAFSESGIDNTSVSGAIDRLLYGDPYFISFDKSALILNVIPEFRAAELEKVERGVNAVEAVVNGLLGDYSDVSAGLTGPLTLNRDKILLARDSLNSTTMLAFAGVLGLLFVVFRSWILPLLAVTVLATGIVWAMGVSFLLAGQLNLMTSVMGVILIGLGIDFAIHVIYTYRRHRIEANDCPEALRLTAVTSGRAVLTSGLTTAAAFFSLMISDSRGMKELGLVTGAGLLAVLVATLLLLPLLLVILDPLLNKSFASVARRPRGFRVSGRFASLIVRHSFASLSLLLIVTVLLGSRAQQMTFDRNSFNMEPRDLVSVQLQDTVAAKFDLSMDYALVLSDSPEQERAVAKKTADFSTIAMVEGIHNYLPDAEEQKRREKYLIDLRTNLAETTGHYDADRSEIIDQLERLEMNVVELQDMAFLEGHTRVDEKCSEIVGNPEEDLSNSFLSGLINALQRSGAKGSQVLRSFTTVFSPLFHEKVYEASSPSTVTYQMLPESVKDRYANWNDSLFLLTVFPEKSVWKDLDFLRLFSSEVQTIASGVTGIPLVFDGLVTVMMRDASIALVVALGVVILLLWIDFRNLLHALLAMVPLFSGLIWMIGFMQLAGLSFTIINVMAFALIVGIGIDDGVHIVHRWRTEGTGRIDRVFESTGMALLLTTASTMIAFGTLMFSSWPSFVSMGTALFIGAGSCYATTCFFMPTLMGIAERRKKEDSGEEMR